MQKIINFIKYHNLFTIILGLVLLVTASSFASEDVRNAVIGEKLEMATGTDNSLILTVDLNNFDLNLQITNVTEDNKNYYIDYIYQTLGILGNTWQEVSKENTLTVCKEDLEGEDLGLYVQEELLELADYELRYLKEVQEIEKEKGQTKFVASVEYTGLIGLVLDIKNMLFPEYIPVVQPQQTITTETPATEAEPPSGGSASSSGVCQNGQTRPCGSEIGVCQIGVEVCQQGIWGECIGAVMPQDEICDEVDNDCDGQIDEGCQVTETPTSTDETATTTQP